MAVSRVGIITFHRAVNYGAVLQTYALYETLDRMGVQAVIVDYRNPILEKRHKRHTIVDCTTLKDYIRLIWLSRNYNRKHDRFRVFRDENLTVSDPYFQFEDLRKAAGCYDKFVCGSDQVWNGNITGLDPAYFLTFADDVQRNSYAASFGFGELSLSEKDDYRVLLEGFEHMSVREKHGAQIIKQLLNRDVEVVLDPTLLLGAEEWGEIAIEAKKDGYILVYGFSGRHYLDFARNLAKRTSLPIIRLANPYLPSKKISHERSAGPREFLGLFQNAAYVVTNSFHGTVFAINFNKPFFIEMLPESTGVNSRLEHVLDLFNLWDRLIISAKVPEVDLSINYHLVNQILEVERKKSLKFLQKAVFD